MFTPERRSQGFTLLELVLLIGVLATGLVGILLTYQTVVKSSANPQVQKQALAIGEALLDEILLNSYDPIAGGGASRADFNDVDDYAGYSTAGGIVDINGVPVTGLLAYNVSSVTVTPTSLNGVAEAKLITVTVTGPNGYSIALDGWRLRYDGP